MENKNPRNAGRKPIPQDKKGKTIAVVLPPQLFSYVQNQAEKEYITPSAFIRELIKKDMVK